MIQKRCSSDNHKLAPHVPHAHVLAHTDLKVSTSRILSSRSIPCVTLPNAAYWPAFRVLDSKSEGKAAQWPVLRAYGLGLKATQSPVFRV